MAKEMQVVSWDDIHLADGIKVEAQHVDVAVQFGPFEGVLDLTEEHYARAEASFRELFGSVFDQKAALQVAEKSEADKKKYQSQSPLEYLCPYPAKTPERNRWLKSLRWWADSVGRAAEYMPPEGSKKDKNQYHYPKQLLLDYLDFLSQEAAKKLAS